MCRSGNIQPELSMALKEAHADYEKVRRWVIMKALLIDVANIKVEVVEIGESPSEWNELLHCCYVHITSRMIGDMHKRYNIIYDDGALLKENYPSALDDSYSICMEGNLLITSRDNDGELTDLSEEDIRYLNNYIVHICEEESGRIWKAIWGMH